MTPPDEREVDKRRFDVSLAQLDLKEAQKSLEELFETADNATISDQRVQIALIRVNIDQTEDDLAELKSARTAPSTERSWKTSRRQARLGTAARGDGRSGRADARTTRRCPSGDDHIVRSGGGGTGGQATGRFHARSAVGRVRLTGKRGTGAAYRGERLYWSWSIPT